MTKILPSAARIRKFFGRSQLLVARLVVEARSPAGVWHRALTREEGQGGVVRIPAEPSTHTAWHSGASRRLFNPVICVPCGSTLQLTDVRRVLAQGATLTGTIVWPTELDVNVLGATFTRQLPPSATPGMSTVAVASSPLVLGRRQVTKDTPQATCTRTLSEEEIAQGKNVVAVFLHECLTRGITTLGTNKDNVDFAPLWDLQRLNELFFRELAPSIANLYPTEVLSAVPDHLKVQTFDHTHFDFHNAEESSIQSLPTLIDVRTAASQAHWEKYLNAVSLRDCAEHTPRAKALLPVVPPNQIPQWAFGASDQQTREFVLSIDWEGPSNNGQLILRCDGLANGEIAVLKRLDTEFPGTKSAPDSAVASWVLAHGDSTSLEWVSTLSIGAYRLIIRDSIRGTAHIEGDAVAWRARCMVNGKELSPNHPAVSIGFHTSMPGGVMISSPLHQGDVDDPRNIFNEDPGPVKPGTCFIECFGGKETFADPVVVAADLRAQNTIQTISCARAGMHTPLCPLDKVESVLCTSADWVRALLTSEFIITNDTLPSWFNPRPGQRVLQTWHGKPVKLLGKFTPRGASDEWYRRAIINQARFWDKLFTRDSIASKRMRSAFDYAGTISEGIAPAISAALQTPAGQRRTSARARLGIAPEAFFVSVLPTWFDIPPHFTSTINIENAQALINHATQLALENILYPEQAIVVGTRLHHMVRQAMPLEFKENVGKSSLEFRDYGDWHDVRDLYAAADLVVSDYSSALQDAADLEIETAVHRPYAQLYEHYIRGLFAEDCFNA